MCVYKVCTKLSNIEFAPAILISGLVFYYSECWAG